MFFTQRLSQYFMESDLPVINLYNVRYEVFARLLGMIHPEAISPQEEFFDSILELAKQLSMPAISRLIQQMIQRESHLNFYEVLTLADKHGMKDLVDTCINYITSDIHLDKMKKQEIFEFLSDVTKSKLFNKFLKV